ncbi:endonuclease/exonuclease/phosphatase family protein [Bradyrhizobium sp. NBAIM01]|uniref:endonuclease/exonuclease/phosphatase family protein n=1 Tax=Bradyrhizobium sp. NBAIM01 TaxID=2793818 RepID=UPI001CD2E59E|nr:endonuclease/exonuclease/phosphatase family protein [Bradyrhizobium sp. NBAIM01]MCA1510194.1 endonuclease/exonuclease/phosphatase family protein [Bradyrhizobium sp. NBAIM01]
MTIRQSVLIALVFLLGATPAAHAREIRIATWNLGWHISQSEAKEWIRDCGQPFALNPASGLFEPATTGATKPGWELKWGRNAKIKWDIAVKPPCDVYQANFKIVPVTEAAYQKRAQQLQDFIRTNLDPDIITFQEVSGATAVREVLPNKGADYEICSFDTFKVQRLAIAWKKNLGTGSDCSVIAPLSLPDLATADQVRPGLSLTLQIDGKPLRVMTVHLKSSCVSPLEDRGKLDGGGDACAILQKQVHPLEDWLEASSASMPVVLMGDFNRNFSHEKNSIPKSAIRSDGSDSASPLPTGVLVRSLYGEVNDGAPASSALLHLEPECQVNPVAKQLCERSTRELFDQEALKPLTKAESLGCRNPVGLDQMLVSASLSVPDPAIKVAIGRFGGTRPAGPGHPDPLLAISDHCPSKATLRF